MQQNILSPITKTQKVKYIRTIDVSWIVNQWQKAYSFDVGYLFNGLKEIDIFECQETRYRFFYPAIMGDTTFYQHYQKFRKHSSLIKWEHLQAFKIISVSDCSKMLEIGCAEGDFLEHVRLNSNIVAVGLELNQRAVSRAKEKGLDVHIQSLEEHTLLNKDKYDWVCSFQVLEHIADVDSFMTSSIECLKPGGHLVISVPNNKSFISETDQILNMPPHHVGLWDEHSLRSLSNFYKLQLNHVLFEPLQEYHINFFKNSVYSKVLGKKFQKRHIRVIYKLLYLKPLVDTYLEYVTKWIPGHTILAVFQKT